MIFNKNIFNKPFEDAPLHSLRAEILDWPHGQLMQKVYSRTLIEKMIDFHLEKENGEFQTFRNVLDVTNPILLIQSEDDEIGEILFFFEF